MNRRIRLRVLTVLLSSLIVAVGLQWQNDRVRYRNHLASRAVLNRERARHEVTVETWLLADLMRLIPIRAPGYSRRFEFLQKRIENVRTLPSPLEQARELSAIHDELLLFTQRVPPTERPAALDSLLARIDVSRKTLALP
jgi:hypothetical protein